MSFDPDYTMSFLDYARKFDPDYAMKFDPDYGVSFDPDYAMKFDPYYDVSSLCDDILITYHDDEKIVQKIRDYIEKTVEVYDEYEHERKKKDIKHAVAQDLQYYKPLIHELIVQSRSLHLMKCLVKYIKKMKIEDIDSYMEHFHFDKPESCEIKLLQLFSGWKSLFVYADKFSWVLEQKSIEIFTKPTMDECLYFAYMSCKRKYLEILATLVRVGYIKYTDFPEGIRKFIKESYDIDSMIDIMGLHYHLDYCYRAPDCLHDSDMPKIKHSAPCQFHCVLMDCGIDCWHSREVIISLVREKLL